MKIFSVPGCHSKREVSSVVALLRTRSDETGESVGYRFLGDGEKESDVLTYAELDERSRCIAAQLQATQAPGHPVLLLYPPGLEFTRAFFGCLYAGCIAVPSHPPDPLRLSKSLPRLKSILEDARAATVLTTGDLFDLKKHISDYLPEAGKLNWVETDRLPASMAADWLPVEPDPGAIAFLQYTSGSTGNPKGVMVSHHNLLDNAAKVFAALGGRPGDSYFSWLPLFHDMGFMAGILQPLYAAVPAVLMSPGAFLERPVRWLQAISEYRATISGGPNFAYDLCVRRVTESEKNGLDLSGWQVAFNGAEPIRADTIKRFSEAFASCGFRSSAFYPCYGLAEATLMVSGGPRGGGAVVSNVSARGLETNVVAENLASESDARHIIGCGSVLAGQTLRVVDPESFIESAPNQVGEIWVTGPSVAAGYWNRSGDTEESFNAHIKNTGEGPFLRTGDLGFVRDGQLFVTGRLKDLIIIRGLNHYPQDIERTVDVCHPVLRRGCAAAFQAGEEAAEAADGVGVVLEVSNQTGVDFEQVFGAIRRTVSENHELDITVIALIRAGRIPKTSSGKIQRRLCRSLLMSESLEVVAEWRKSIGSSAVVPDAPSRTKSADCETIADLLVAKITALLGINASDIDRAKPLADYGLDSLASVELVHELEQVVGAGLRLAQFAGSMSVNDLSAAAVSQAETDTHGIYSQIAASETDSGEWPLSEGQKGLWFVQQTEPRNPVYNIAKAIRVRSHIDSNVFKNVVEILVQRHPCLRTTFVFEENEPKQRVHSDLTVNVVEQDASELTAAELELRVKDDAYRPFDLQEGPLLRINLYRLPSAESVMLIVVHHLVADFWSLSIFIQEMGILYRALATRAEPSLRTIPSRYRDFVKWQTEILSGPEGEVLSTYWKNRLPGEVPPLEIRTDRPYPQDRTYGGASHRIEFDDSLAGELESLARSSGVTLYALMLAAYQTLLIRYSGRNEVVVGTPVAGRSRREFRRVFGYFVNPVVLRADVAGNPEFDRFLVRVSGEVHGALQHQDYPLPLLMKDLQIRRDQSRAPLFQTMLIMQRSVANMKDRDFALFAVDDPTASIDVGGLRFEPYPIESIVTEFDITMIVAAATGRLAGVVQYRTDLFDRSTMQRFARHYENLLKSIVRNPANRISDLEILAEAELTQLLFEWNAGTPADFDLMPLPTLVEAEAAAVPDAVAVVFEEAQTTYGELERRSRRLAEHLLHNGIGPGKTVGVLVHRSAEMVTVLLGVMKSGVAYVPLDPGYPVDRLIYMAQDARISLLITEVSLETLLIEAKVPALCVDRDWAKLGGADRASCSLNVSAEDVAYVIYTSGSTGRPKGVMVTHGGLSNILLSVLREVQPCERDTLAAITTICFDIAGLELFLPLLSRGRLFVVGSDAASNGAELMKLLDLHSVAFLQGTPATWRLLLESGWKESGNLTALCGGETLPRELADALLDRASALWNLYGPTETTIWSTLCRIERGDLPPSIGLPVARTDLYVLSEELTPVPVGVAGDLYIGGTGVAYGYLNRPDLTAGVFVPHPFSDRQGERLYQTGDRVVRLADGTLQFLGRSDYQVKVRGYRIELGEIEAVLNQHPAVKQAAVVIGERGRSDKSVVAYLVLDSEITPDELRSFARGRLPEYMTPSAFVKIDTMPLTANGKINRRALAALAEARPAEPDAQAAPRSPVEQMLAEIWSDLLGAGSLSVDADFFSLGGHSLLAARSLHRIRDLFNVNISIREFFSEPTIRGLAKIITAQRSGADRVAPEAPLPAGPYDGALPLSFAQEPIWFLEQVETDSYMYNMPAAVRLTGNLNPAALEQSFGEIVARHLSLRTSFRQERGRPVQMIQQAATGISVIDLGALDPGEQQREVRRRAVEEARRPFNLSVAPLLRVTLLKCHATEHVMLITVHHIVSDGWSLALLINELSVLYETFNAGRHSYLSQPAAQYVDFARWQRERLRDAALEDRLAFWKNQLGGEPPNLELSISRSRTYLKTYDGARESLVLNDETTRRLRALASEQGCTLFIVLLAAFKCLLLRYSGVQDILVGTTVANRNRRETEAIIGCFVNTVVLRTGVSAGLNFVDLIRRVRETAVAAFAYHDLPFEKVVEAIQPDRSLDRNPLFRIMFTLQNDPFPRLALPGLKPEVLDFETITTKNNDLNLSIDEVDGALRASLEYSIDLFERSSIAAMLRHYERVLKSMIDGPGRRIANLPLMTDAERTRLFEADRAAARYTTETCIHRLFEQNVDASPDRIALISSTESLSYQELNRRADQTAAMLAGYGAGPETIIGIASERSLEMIVGLLAILKTGAAYQPLDPDHPAERLEFMLSDAGVSIVLAGERLMNHLTSFAGRVLSLAAVVDEAAGTPDRLVTDTAGPANLAYVIYTSGSTGTPKGVAITHESLCNAILWFDQSHNSGSEHRLLHKTSLSFDVSAWEIFWPLTSGGAIVLARPDGQYDPDYIADEIERHQITVINSPPAMLDRMTREGRLERCRSLELIACGGEALSLDLKEEIVERYTVGLENYYGPTETTISSTFWNCREEGSGGRVLIGRPYANTWAYILDCCFELAPPGSVGELFIGGIATARNYVNRADLTALGFVPDPFSRAPGARMYATGDLVRLVNGGNLEFIGRADAQIKLRGYRIELGEIEEALRQCDGVLDAAVILDDSLGEKRLIGYYVPSQPGSPDSREVTALLKRRLPEYMAPSILVMLTELPRTISGKVDRRALPLPRPESSSHEGYIAPRTVVEEVIAAIFSDVLGLERVGVFDDFFEMGGHSLLAVQATARLCDALNIAVPIRSLFENPTVAALGQYVADYQKPDTRIDQPLRRVAREPEMPISFAQLRLWFLHQLEPDNPVYGIGGAIAFEGRLNNRALSDALGEVVRRHESLRTTFANRNGLPLQTVAGYEPAELGLIDLSRLKQAEETAWRLAAQQNKEPFDLTTGPLFRVRLVRVTDEKHYLFVTMHHIVSDGWSVEVLIREICGLYRVNLDGEPSPLPELEIQYVDYARWQHEWLQGEVLAEQLQYWKDRLRDAARILPLPTDLPRPPVYTYAGAAVSLTTDGGLAARLAEMSRREGVTLFMALLAGFKALLFRYTGQSDLSVGVPVAARSRKELERIVGMFVNTLALRGVVAPDDSFRRLMQIVREATLGAFTHEEAPFEKIVEELEPDRNLAFSPLFQVMFALQDVRGLPRELPGLRLSFPELPAETAKFDLTLAVIHSDDLMRIVIEYRTDLFEAETVERMLHHYENILRQAAAEPARRIADFNLFGDQELNTILYEWNRTAVEFVETSVPRLIDEVANACPDRMAVVDWDGNHLSYGCVVSRSLRIANALSRLGVSAEERVGACIDRRFRAIEAALGIMSAGAAYLPLDSEYPRERLQYMIDDARARFVLTDSSLESLIAGFNLAGVTALNIDEIVRFSEDDSILPTAPLETDQLAYVIYTSGTTGKPKGVMITHGALNNALKSFEVTHGSLVPEARVLQKASPAFDVSIWEMFWPLISAGVVIMAPKGGQYDVDWIKQALIDEAVSAMNSVPSMLRLMVESAAFDEAPNLKVVACGGESLPSATKERFTASVGATLVNFYGPTETAISSTYWNCETGPAVLIGTPFANTSLYILDPNMQPAPIGVPGEIWIAGAGVARGYLAKTDETGDKFIPDPFARGPGRRMYRTGDLGRYDSSGRIEFLGRRDEQIKLRGYRIELGEIEAELQRLVGVAQSAVVLKEGQNGDKKLVGYVVPQDGHEVRVNELKARLREKMPEYMTPAVIVTVEQLPLTENGKVNRSELASREIAVAEERDPDDEREMTPVEEVVAGIWEEVLERGDFGPDGNFFDLGGHSLMVTQVSARIERIFWLKLPLQNFFEHPTVSGLAAAVLAHSDDPATIEAIAGVLLDDASVDVGAALP